MRKKTSHMAHKLLATGIVLSVMLSMTATAFALDPTETMLRLQPHCMETDRTKCAQFDIADAKSLTTAPLSTGDLLDIDVVVLSPTPTKILAIRSWLTYDPAVLEVRDVQLLPALANPIPTENTADPQNKVIKIGGGTDNKLTVKEAAIARITMSVKSDAANTEISFAQFKEDGTGLTGVLSNDQSVPSLLTIEPAKLSVVMKNAGTVSSISSSSSVASMNSAMSSSESSITTGTSGESTFTKLQVQNTRVTSSDTSLFVGWDALKSSELVGYNVYYGTISGRYIQRRTLNKESASLTIRGLESGVQYFVSVRGINGSNEETAFSDEAAVVIGRPETSTAPLFDKQNGGPDGNPVETRGGQVVTGESGMGEMMLAFLILSAVIGTGFAARRNFFSSQA